MLRGGGIVARPHKRYDRHLKKTDVKRPCPSGKTAYRHEKEAASSPHGKRKGLVPYLCTDCKHWHLAHPLTRRQRQSRARRSSHGEASR